jgi:ParB family chromosome partitioning protein
MATAKSRLGRGLGALIAASTANPKSAAAAASAPDTSAKPAPAAAPVVAAAPTNGFLEVPVAAVEPNPYQPRKAFDPGHLAELVASIRQEGLLQPIVVRKAGDKYQLVAGERRWRAFQQLKLKTIPARLVEANDASSATLALIENLQREGLNPIEEAYGYASLIRDFDLTQESAAERLGRNRATIANSLRLLALDAEIQGYLAKELLSAGHAKALLGIESPQERAVLARRIIEEGLSVRAAEKLVQQRRHASPAKVGIPGPVPPAEAAAVASIEKRLTSHLGARVTVKHAKKRGRIVIEYQGNTDLERILDRLGVRA